MPEKKQQKRKNTGCLHGFADIGKWRKITALLLAAALSVPALTGCGSGKNSVSIVNVLIHITSICFLWFILYYSHRNLSIPKIDFGGFTKIPTNSVCIMYISQKIETISPLFFIVRLAYPNLIIILEIIFSPHSFKPFEPPSLTGGSLHKKSAPCQTRDADLETHVTNDTMHTRKAKGVHSAPHSPQIFCTNSVPSFKTNTIFPSRCTTAFSTAASHNCVSNSGSIPFCPLNAL